MFFGNNVSDTRQLFYTSWIKYRQKQPLTALEQQLVAVIIDHPEYQPMLEKKGGVGEEAYFPEMGQANPFLHMGLHLAVRDQIATNKPIGINQHFQRLSKKYNDSLVVEHMIIECLAECLWQAQRDNREPDEVSYLNNLSRLS
ncbi:MAG: DUF1841 family protein [Legionella sp.]|nr:DUF1841 family protein [Legionella sp.]